MGQDPDSRAKRRFQDYYSNTATSQAIEDRYTTRYQLLVVIEGQDDVNQDGSFEMVVEAKDGWTKPKEEEDTGYDGDPLWQYIEESKPGNEAELRAQFEQKNTVLNIDERCHVSGEQVPFSKNSSLFSSKEYQDFFFKYFEDKCGYKNKCSIDINRNLASSPDQKFFVFDDYT